MKLLLPVVAFAEGFRLHEDDLLNFALDSEKKRYNRLDHQ